MDCHIDRISEPTATKGLLDKADGEACWARRQSKYLSAMTLAEKVGK